MSCQHTHCSHQQLHEHSHTNTAATHAQERGGENNKISFTLGCFPPRCSLHKYTRCCAVMGHREESQAAHVIQSGFWTPQEVCQVFLDRAVAALIYWQPTVLLTRKGLTACALHTPSPSLRHLLDGPCRHTKKLVLSLHLFRTSAIKTRVLQEHLEKRRNW